MLYDGLRWTLSRRVIVLSSEHWLWNPNGNYGPVKDDSIRSYITFGRYCKPSTRGAIKTERFWQGPPPRNLRGRGYEPEHEHPDTKEPMYRAWVLPIVAVGHTATNVCCGQDRTTYLALNGKVYVRTAQRRQKELHKKRMARVNRELQQMLAKRDDACVASSE